MARVQRFCKFCVMKPAHFPESIEACAERLKLTRLAAMNGEDNQAKWCRLVQISTSKWNNAETGDNWLALENALKLCQRYGITLDWIYRGDMQCMSSEMRDKIANLQAAKPAKRA